MFLLAFILPSFTIAPQDSMKNVSSWSKATGTTKEFNNDDRIIYKPSQDSLLILFSNPEITVKDDRMKNKENFQDLFVKALCGEFERYNEAVAQHNANVERRWSVLDRIETDTGFTRVEALHFIDQKRKLYQYYAALSVLWVIIMVIVYITEFRRLKGLVLVQMLLYAAITGALALLGYVTIGGGYDYHVFWTLFNHLSP
jgi:hypothetical protein